MSDAGHPPRIVENYIRTYFEGTQEKRLEYFEFLFSFDRDTSVKDVERRAKSLADRLHK